ncbi:MAG TPA: hypothetical protein VHG92_04340 [Afifellaceae bacterium]|nr:hypothetical protein [Afifellaceae bacterium]
MHSLSILLRGALAAATIHFAAGAAVAGPVVEAAERAEELADAGEPVRALEALDEAVAVVWQQAPLGLRTWAIVDEVGGYGIYDPREEAVFRPGETMRVYLEPVGFVYASQGDMHEVGLSADLAIETPRGQIIVEAKDLFSMAWQSRNRIRELPVTFAFRVPELVPDEYRATFTVRDRNSEKTGEFSVPFRVGEAP